MPDHRTDMRRVDRAMDDRSEMRALLDRVHFGTLATSIDAQPYQNLNLFWFDAGNRRIYLHTAHEGRTRSNIEANPLACFSAGEIGRLLPADTALEFSVEYASVIAFGRARIVEDEEEARQGLQGLLDKYFPDLEAEVDYRGITEDELRRTTVIALDVESMSGKRKVADS